MAVLVVVVLALLAAAVVVLVATVEAPGSDGERPVRAFLRGLRAWVRPDDELRAEARTVAAIRPVDVSLEQMLRATVEQGGGYLEATELTGSLHAAAVRVLSGHGRDDEV